jgi:hypothetical protein
MVQNNNSNLRRNIEDMLNDETFYSVLQSSAQKLIPTLKRSIFLLITLCIIFMFLYFNKEVNNNIILKFSSINKDFSGILLALFAVVLTGYAIFQALANGPTLVNLMTVSEEEKSKFKHYNMSFFSITILYLALIILNFFLYLFFSLISPKWYFPFLNNELNTYLALALFSLYIVIIFHALFELKSFIYNLYQCFSINAASKGIDYLIKYKEDQSEK